MPKALQAAENGVFLWAKHSNRQFRGFSPNDKSIQTAKIRLFLLLVKALQTANFKALSLCKSIWRFLH